MPLRTIQSEGQAMDETTQVPEQPEWFTRLDPRQQDAIKHARAYAKDYSAAGAPGHGQFLLIAKLADLLDRCADVQ